MGSLTGSKGLASNLSVMSILTAPPTAGHSRISTIYHDRQRSLASLSQEATTKERLLPRGACSGPLSPGLPHPVLYTALSSSHVQMLVTARRAQGVHRLKCTSRAQMCGAVQLVHYEYSLAHGLG